MLLLLISTPSTVPTAYTFPEEILKLQTTLAGASKMAKESAQIVEFFSNAIIFPVTLDPIISHKKKM